MYILDVRMSKEESAAERRMRELKALAAEGVRVRFECPWKARVGTLHIWPYAGRWLNEVTGEGGRINHATMRELISRFCSTLCSVVQ
jgi:hypothetical protein